MNKSLLTAGALGLMLATGSWATANEHGGHGGHGGDRGDRYEQHLDRMAERLELDDTQRARIEALMKQHHERTAEARAAMKQSHEQMRTEMRAILNEDQIAKMDEMHEGKGKGKGMKKGDGREKRHDHEG